jgi:excisionase family DNA binding protein
MNDQELPDSIIQAIRTMTSPHGDWTLIPRHQKKNKKDKQYLCVDDATTYLGNISRTTLYRKVKYGDIPCINIGSRVMFEISDLDKYMRKNKTYKTTGNNKK